jgi:hypothetical protein
MCLLWLPESELYPGGLGFFPFFFSSATDILNKRHSIYEFSTCIGPSKEIKTAADGHSSNLLGCSCTGTGQTGGTEDGRRVVLK